MNKRIVARALSMAILTPPVLLHSALTAQAHGTAPEVAGEGLSAARSMQPSTGLIAPVRPGRTCWWNEEEGEWWDADGKWKLDYLNLEQIGEAELQRRREEFDRQKELARPNRVVKAA